MRLIPSSVAVALVAATATRLFGQPGTPVLPARELEAGVVVLKHGADAFTRAAQWSLSATAAATAGGRAAGPDYDLTDVRNVEMLSDGRIATLAPIGNRLLVFAANGRGERTLAREGTGPGEIKAPGGMSRIAGDTLVVPDPGNNRVNWIVAGKGIVASKPLPKINKGPFVRPVGALRNGQLVMSTAGLVQSGVTDRVTRPTASILLLSQRADAAKVIAEIPDLEVIRIPTRYGGTASSETVVLRMSRWGMSAAWDTVIATGSGDGYRIDLRNPNGDMISSIRVAAPRRPITKTTRDLVLANVLRQFEGSTGEAMVDAAESRRVAQATPFADAMPPYGGWFVAPDRTLWIVDPVMPGASRGSATGFRQDGAIVARLGWAGTGTPVAFGTDRVVMRESDAGATVLRVYRIEK
jgi:hypothetical protein